MKRSSLVLWTLLLMYVFLSPYSFGEETIRIGITTGRVRVETVSAPSTKVNPGILVWSAANGRELWSWWGGKGDWPIGRDETLVSELNFSGTRGGGSTATALGSLQGTFQLPQLATEAKLRGDGAISTPVNHSVVLTSQTTFRRISIQKDGQEIFPPASVEVLDSQNKTLFTFRWKEGEKNMPWAKLTNVPAAFSQGLPAGKYRLRVSNVQDLHEFEVADAAISKGILAPVAEMEQLLGKSHPQLLLLYRVRLLLNQPQGKAYLTDALEAFETASAEQSSVKLIADLQRQLSEWTENLARSPDYKHKGLAVGSDDPTGDNAIDKVRALLNLGSFSEAEVLLTQYQPSAERAQGLKTLYQAVIAAESGIGRQSEADERFAQALDQLKSPTDLARAQNNYASFLLRAAQDRLNNHAFQMATGGEGAISRGLLTWQQAESLFQKTLQEAKSEKDKSVAQLNLGCSYALLADYVTTLVAPPGEESQFSEIAAAATKQATMFLSEAAKSEDVQLRGIVFQIEADLAFRQKDWKTCAAKANAALSEFVAQGSLSGVESIERLLGLLAREQKQPAAALQHFQVSHHISELLRAQFPADRMGVSRAGFFARRGYVYEQLVELLVAQGEHRRALHYAELAKARAAQDLLAVNETSSAAGLASTGGVDALLSRWPKEVAAVEYFLGDRGGFIFLIDPAGNVKAWPIRDAGEPLSSRDLVQKVSTFLKGVEGQSTRMRQAILSGRGFDWTWQHDLHKFRSILLPDEILTSLRAVKQVVIVPHHILHYFPFAAMVTKLDETLPEKFRMASPQFLLDEQFALLYSPSLMVWDALRRKPAVTTLRANAIGIVEVPGAPPLPGVEKDLENFRTIFGTSVKIVINGTDATDTKAKSVLAESGILLVATHGFNDPDHPLDSFLLFLNTPGKESNGQLRARDILSTKVNANMVVMSACFSGLGDRSPLPGDDLYGLQRAFLMSGSQIVVSGLWDVYDGTAPVLMEGYFQGIQKKQPPSLALAESQRAFLKTQRQSEKPGLYIHPYFWAVYTVAGGEMTAK